ncbi:transcriptional regulator GlxA family with amidase domain [Oceanisphaera litoralis]|uniref:GlxA family transcriptional regulator n=1 Tax=Oceanisphaera litoralis TaxID=225144 RepID=UPI00195E0F69|nr:GlxA family transcriptional regulator [Oceanisphaera litoralis]MBM7457225.1 transcriptional regulator GlxA family with amidase domain [Oceanisphaera litoralis]
MSQISEKRYFSHRLRDTNSAFLPARQSGAAPIRVGFVLQPHFSMMAFTAAVDALVTANLVQATPLFGFTIFGLDAKTVRSDLAIDISANATLDELTLEGEDALDVLIVCGGFRCSLSEHPPLSRVLKAAAKRQKVLGGLWNGAVALAHAGVLDGLACALHPDNHAVVQEGFPRVQVSPQPMVVEARILTSAGPNSALEMMLALVERLHGRETVRAINEILSSDRIVDDGDTPLSLAENDPTMPDALRTLLRLMNSNIEEPLGIEELADYVGLSRRRIERLFQSHLETTPSRYYLELRITHARRLLLQSSTSISGIAVACGFVSSTHFSHCFKDFFGISPSQARQKRG